MEKENKNVEVKAEETPAEGATSDETSKSVGRQAENQIDEQSSSTGEDQTKADKADEEEINELTTLHERTIAAMSYISFLAIVPLYLKKDSKFCRFHGKQGLLIAILFFFFQLFMVLDFLDDLANIAQFGIFVWMGLAALSGKWKKFPWIYKTACDLEAQLSLKEKDDENAYSPSETPKADEVNGAK